MTFIPVRRKADPDPEDTTGEETSPEEHDEQETAATDAEPTGFFKAFAIGVRGWLTWCSSRIGVRWTYGLHIVALWATGQYSLWVTYGIGIALTLAVVAFMPHAPLDRLTARIERRDREAAAEHLEQPSTTPDRGPSADPLPALLWQLIGEAPGVHRKTLTEVLAQALGEGSAEALTEAAVEEALTARGIPLRPSVRDARKKVNRGVHRDDLTAWEKALSPTPSDATAPPS